MISKLSRFYGSDPSIVLAGGGNTSCKIGDRLFVKASGTSLATMTPDGFVEMDRDAARRAGQRDARRRSGHARSAVQGGHRGARCEPREGAAAVGRGAAASLAAGHVCRAQPRDDRQHAHLPHETASELAEEIFGDSILWLPYVDPGFTLAQTLKQALAEHRPRNGTARGPRRF